MQSESLSKYGFVKKITEITQKHLPDEHFGVTQLAKEMGLSRVTLYRKTKLLTNKSATQFIKETRLKKALELLKQKDGTVSEIGYNVGFNSPAYFIKCFHDYYGHSPGEILKSDYHIHTNKARKKRKNTI